MQLAAAGYLVGIGVCRFLYAKGNVGVQLTEQAVPQMSGGDIFALLARQGAGESAGACLSVALGSSLAAALSLGVLWALRREGPPLGREDRTPWRRVFALALPVGLADDLRAGVNTVENLIIPRRLALYAGTVNAMADYGVLHGMVFPVLMFPAAILGALADLLVAEFSRCASHPGQVRVRYLARQGLRVSWLFGICAGGMIFAAARPLGELLYHSEAAGACLRLYAPLVPILYLDVVVDAMCKGLGQQSANARYNLLTNLMDVALLWLLLPRFGMGGYYFSFAASHLVNFGMSLRRLGRSVELGPLGPLVRGPGRRDLLWLRGLLGGGRKAGD